MPKNQWLCTYHKWLTLTRGELPFLLLACGPARISEEPQGYNSFECTSGWVWFWQELFGDGNCYYTPILPGLVKHSCHCLVWQIANRTNTLIHPHKHATISRWDLTSFPAPPPPPHKERGLGMRLDPSVILWHVGGMGLGMRLAGTQQGSLCREMATYLSSSASV